MKERLDVILVEQGYAPSREKAKAIIMSGNVYVNGQKIKCVMTGIPDAYVEHGNVELLKKEIGLDAASITEKILERL